MATLFELSESQSLMQSGLQRWLDDHGRFEQRAAYLQQPAAIEPLWQGLSSELGLTGAGLPESAGGWGGGLADQALLCEALGAAMLPDPYLACVVTAGSLLQALAPNATAPWLAGLAEGRLRPVLAALEPGGRHDLSQVHTRLSATGCQVTGRKALVRSGPWATHWLVSALDQHGVVQVAVVEPGAAGITRRDVRLADGSWACEIALEQTQVVCVLPGNEAGGALQALALARDHSLLATGAEAVGLMHRVMQDTLDHVRQRRQFNVPLASFQVLQHRLADMHMAWLQAHSLVGATLAQVDGPAAARTRAVASCQVAVASACKVVGQGAVQLHGGMGMTDELAVGHAFKRLTLIEHHFGGITQHLRQVAFCSASA